MYPELFTFTLFGQEFTIASYGTMIALGIVLGTTYAARLAQKRLGLHREVFWDMVLMLIIVCVVGGKFFFYLENPSKYLSEPSKMLENFGNGFVFYGSLIFGVIGLLVFFRIKKIPMLPMFDIIALMAAIIHSVGRLGCFFAGCCYGLPHDHWFSLTFSHPDTAARPMNTPLYPTQLMSAAMVFSIFLILRVVEQRKQFAGQVALIYLMLYAIGRSIVEEFRGDEARGFIFDQAQLLSHSQFISLLILLFAAVMYYLLWKRQQPGKTASA